MARRRSGTELQPAAPALPPRVCDRAPARGGFRDRLSVRVKDIHFRTEPGGVGRTTPAAAASYNPVSMPPSRRESGRSAADTRSVIETFLQSCRQPALLEPGEELLPLTGDNLALNVRDDRLTLQAWDRNRNLTRRVSAV